MTAPVAVDPPLPDDAVISLRGVTKRFGSHTVLKDLTFDVPRGRISAVLGPSGTGKSVLLKNIIGLLRPEEGQIYVDGEPIVGIRHKDMLRIRRKFGVLFQDGALFGSMDIFDNIAFPLREHTNKGEREIKALVLEKAEMVGMVAHLKKLPGEISGGMRKRAGLARALILDPDIVFFDEPDSGLDPVRVAYLDELVKQVQQETGCTFFIITHNIDSVKRTADYIGMLYRSSLVRFGPAKDMFVSDRALIKQFLAGSNVGPIGMDEMVDAARGEADVAALLADGDSPEPAARQAFGVRIVSSDVAPTEKYPAVVATDDRPRDHQPEEDQARDDQASVEGAGVGEPGMGTEPTGTGTEPTGTGTEPTGTGTGSTAAGEGGGFGPRGAYSNGEGPNEGGSEPAGCSGSEVAGSGVAGSEVAGSGAAGSEVAGSAQGGDGEPAGATSKEGRAARTAAASTSVPSDTAVLPSIGDGPGAPGKRPASKRASAKRASSGGKRKVPNEATGTTEPD